MRKKIFIAWLLISMIMSTAIVGQDLEYKSMIDSINGSKNIRKEYIYSSIGILEFLAIGVGYQLSPKFSISVKSSGPFIGGGYIFPNGAEGIGTKISYYVPFSIFNCINFESILLLHQTLDDQTPAFIKGYFLDINIGKEIIDKNGLRVFWGVGICGNDTADVPGRFFYSIKIGLNYNFL